MILNARKEVGQTVWAEQEDWFSVDPAILGLSISMIIYLAGIFQWCIRMSAEVVNHMVSVERVVEFGRIEPEAALEEPGDAAILEAKWPQDGDIEYKNETFDSSRRAGSRRYNESHAGNGGTSPAAPSILAVDGRDQSLASAACDWQVVLWFPFGLVVVLSGIFLYLKVALPPSSYSASVLRRVKLS